MSRSSMYVQFPDGTVRYGIYNETIGEPWGPLFDDLGEAWDAWNVYYREETFVDPIRPTSMIPDPVEVFIGSSIFSGRVTHGMADVGHLYSYFSDETHELVPQPDWVRKAIREANAKVCPACGYAEHGPCTRPGPSGPGTAKP